LCGTDREGVEDIERQHPRNYNNDLAFVEATATNGFGIDD